VPVNTKRIDNCCNTTGFSKRLNVACYGD